MTNGEPSVVVKKGSPSDVVAKQEKSKVVVPGMANKPIIIVEGAHTDPVIIKPGLTRSGRCFALEELRKAKTSRDNPVLVKKAVTKEEAEEFLRKMKEQDYSIVEQLRKTPAQISLLSLLIHSDEHRRALMKILNEAHVLDKILVNHLEKIANKIFEVNRVTFSDDELHVEGIEHNKALYLTVKCEDSVVTKVLVDNGSSANICPLSTLNKLKVDDERIHKNNICVRGFDGRGKDSVGDIVLELTIGPVEFTMEFQVLDVAVSYNLLLGQPWIHVSSTLHQMVKFKCDRQEIIVYGKDNLCAHSDVSVPFIEVEDDKWPWVYQGIIQPVSLPKNLGTFCLGFKPTTKDVKRDKRSKQKAWALPKPVPRLSRSFVKPGARKRLTIVLSSVVDVDEELIESSFYVSFNEMTCMRNLRTSLKKYDEDEAFEKISKELSHFEEKPNSNLNETEAINLGDPDKVKETKISVHLEPRIREEIVKALLEYKDIFVWSCDDMPGLSSNLVVHKLPIDLAFPPVKKKLRKFKTDMSVKIKEEITKQLDAKVIRVTRYPTWLANVVPVPKKDG
ncbi:uncharacterized protein [Nicotiana sylvestris]|uniref:uncharacterized protein n=1 Tax=Nicotiana sylvestris TaxID=4096 RepID=UPI00388CAD1A